MEGHASTIFSTYTLALAVNQNQKRPRPSPPEESGLGEMPQAPPGVTARRALHTKSPLTGAMIGVAVIGIEGETEFPESMRNGRMPQQESIPMPIAIPTPRGVSKAGASPP